MTFWAHKAVYHPASPSIGRNRLLARTLQAAHARGKWVGLCREMAGDSLATPLPLDLGLDEFSRASSAIPAVKEHFHQLDYQACQEIAARVPFNSTETAFLNAKTATFGSPRINASPLWSYTCLITRIDYRKVVSHVLRELRVTTA